MATEKQMDFFKSLFLAEEARTAALRETAKTYLTLTTLYSAFLLFVTEKLRPAAVLPKALFTGAVLAILGAFLAALLVFQVARFLAPSHPDLVMEEYGEEEPSDAEFFDNRIVDYSVACEANTLTNDRKATQLALAGALLLVGLTLHASYFIIWLLEPGGFSVGNG